ncbi:MAG TPA: triose-phosphate isomerase [Propionibacteriaceae bacterium]|jgi:L-erythrulose 1-phosphate isomerase
MTSPEIPKLWVGTSWKMNKTLAEADSFVDQLLTFPIPSGIQPFVLPPYTALARVRDRLPADSPVLLGAQNAHWATEGSWTGEISMRMAKDAGATLIEIGHSERREHFGETDRTVALKTTAAIAHDLTPLICVGEPLAVRDAGGAEDFVRDQLQIGLSELGPVEVQQVIIAYEPIWAIGEHGTPPTLDQIAPVMAMINDVVTTQGGSARAVLYGGSVNATNATDLLSDPNTHGLFVGRAAWEASGFIELLKVCAPLASAGAGQRFHHSTNICSPSPSSPGGFR